MAGTIAPDGGVPCAKPRNLAPAIFDQRRVTLDPESHPVVDARGRAWRHRQCARRKRGMSVPISVIFYSRSANITPRSQPYRVASRNRLLVAKVLAQPSNLLILDEPTNDLDMDTLDLLGGVADRLRGHAAAVSHDRDFLDRLVTSVIAVEGNGRHRRNSRRLCRLFCASAVRPKRQSRCPRSRRRNPAKRRAKARRPLDLERAEGLETLPARIR